ncbi:unnamed protein product [Rotaria sp. Silwood2]|nr:unnamed protein product [Rotaria sp. Silwood2]CAF3045468.1 unnamed protein product [Rotaria sp. Silwood2]CAF3385654.1 unnamed protein product [Rotaria sp. Silwood2]CAF4359550.1 unnamed protein product [Rotaria sp. Silwood2]CAF4362444.1 unnamed protein product [Rotaria sp. Silwood2]
MVRDKDIICIQPGNACLHMHISESFALRALEIFDLTRIVYVDDILFIVEAYCRKRQLVPNIEKHKEILKTTILDRRIYNVRTSFFSCTLILEDPDSCTLNETYVDLDALLGPIYSTRGIKRKGQLVLSDSENSDLEEHSHEQDDLWQPGAGSSSKKNDKKDNISAEKEELRRKFLHIKDEHHITDSAIKAMYKFFRETKEAFYSMAELEQVRNEANRKIPLTFTKDSTYVPFEFALRTAVFVAKKFRSDLL